MKLKRVLSAFLLASAWTFAAQAGTTTFKGVSVDYGSASMTSVGSDVILTYKNSDSLKLGGPVRARVLLVAGGGSGSSGGKNSNKNGYGGHGGVVLDESDVLLTGDCDIAVGAGGAGVNGSTGSRTQGSPGGNSTIVSSFSKSIIRQAYGGGGGGDATPSGSGTASNITGSNKTYGANGSDKDSSGSGSAGTANTGNGGQGGYGASSSGKGGSGVVIVRLTSVVTGANLRDLVLPLDKAADEFRDASDQPMSFVFSEVTCKSSADRVVAAVETADGKLGLQGLYPGRARVTIVKGEKTYLVNVAVVQLVTGSFRIGAYEVAVTNASEVKSVDGDLVITYLNTDAAVAKSFTLPQPTTGRLLAVGGGGAGGQDSGRDEKYGLPGGGGAGGMVMNANQSFAAATYAVTVGAGGAAPRSTTRKTGANGGDSKVAGGGSTLANALGGGGGGARSAGKSGGCGGGGSYSGGTQDGGLSTQATSGIGSGAGTPGGAGKNKLYGAGGGGAGGGGTACDTSSSSSGAGGAGKQCDITGESVEYARGGDGGVPRVNEKYTSDGKEYWVEAEDGKPGLDGRGNGGGGSGHYGSSATYAGSGGSGIVVVRIPPYRTTVEDALKAAFAGQFATVSGNSVTLTDGMTGPIRIPDNLGEVTVNLNGHSIVGVNGAAGDDITAGGAGEPALAIVPHVYDSKADATKVRITGTGAIRGGNGGTGHPAGSGAEAVAGNASDFEIGGSVTCESGADGVFIAQHPHKWAFTLSDDGKKIIAYCVADDGEPCSYRNPDRGPFVAVSAADAAYTAMRYDELTTVNGITPVTGVVIAPETYVGRDGTDYPESSTPPREQGAYTVSMRLGDLKITSDFTITESKAPQGKVYQAWKTAERKGRDVQIVLSATFDGSRAINDGNVLFLGSRCSAHSMGNGTVEKSVNALAQYANVRWYAYGSKEPSNNKVNMLTEKGEEVPDGTVTLVGGNHFVFKEMMDDLYAELVEKKNRPDGYDLLILEFDGDLLGRNGESPYQLVYSLPEGWTDEKAAVLRQAMGKYYDEERVVWIVPDKDQTKSDPGWTGLYPWTSNADFVWQRAMLNAPHSVSKDLQMNYENADELVVFLKKVLVGHFFSKAVIKDKLAEGLRIKGVTPQMRSNGGEIWRNFEGGPSLYTIPEPRSGTTVKADVVSDDRNVEVTFDMKEEQAWACANKQMIGDDFRVVIDAELIGFFNDVEVGGEKETNDGPAVFTFTEANLEGEETYSLPPIEKESPKIQNVKLTPDYTAEDVVRIYDGKGTNIVVTPIVPAPDEAIVRYSLDEHGTYADTLLLTNVCDKTKVWFEITDKNGEFNTVTNFATVTILPRVVVEQAEDATKPFDGTPLTQPAHSNVISQAIVEAEKMYPGQGASAAGFVTGEGFASVPMTADSQQTEVGSHANTIDKNLVTVNEKTDKNNYVFIYLPGILTVTPATMGIEAFPAEKFYDAEPTNITWVVTNAAGVAITDATVSLREKGTDTWIPVADFALYVDTTNVTVEVKAEKTGFDPVEAEATVDIWPRPVTLIAASDSKTFDGLPLTNWTFTVKADATTPGYGFVKDEGVAKVTMTDDSTITDPGSQSNVIASETAKPDTKLERNYIVTTEPGTLTVTAATMGIQAFDAEKFYDAEPTNITYVVTNAAGVAITPDKVYLREKNTTDWIPAANFTLYVDTTNVTVEVRAEKSGFTPVTAEATVDIWPRPVTLIAASDSKTYDGLPLTNWTFTVKADATTPGYGFVKDEGVDRVTMTPESTITDPGSQPNVIASETAKPDTKLERNYTVTTEPGTLTVTAASMGIEAFDAEKFYDAEPTNVTWAVTNAQGVAITDAVISLREKGTDSWSPVADFVPYVDTTNVIVEVKAEKTGFTSVTAEATVLVKPRPVTLVAASDSKVYDGLPLTNWTFTVKADTATPGYGFVKDEGVSKVTMTDDSTITDPGSVDNVIATEIAKPNTKLERNYVVSTEPGTLTVTPAVFTASATSYDEFYDGQEHTIEVEIQKPEEAGEAAVTYSYEEGGTYLPIEDFEQLKDVTAGGPVTVYAKIEVEGYSTVVVNATVNIKPRIVVEQAESASKIFDGTPLVQPNHHEEPDVEAEKSKAKWGTVEVLANSTGFVAGEGFAAVPMTAGSTITEPGVEDNVIDVAAVMLKPNTKADNYIFHFLPGVLEVIQRQEDVRRDPEVVVPEESKKAVEESDKKIEKVLDELVNDDPKADSEPYIKYQLTVTAVESLDETTRTTPEVAEEAIKNQIELAERTFGVKVDDAEFVDIVLERTYDKSEAERTACGNYNKDNWEPLDKAEEHGNRIFEVTIPFELPEGMELVGVTRSCDKGDDVLEPKDPGDPDAEGFVYHPETKTITLYAREFCVFGFIMRAEDPACMNCPWGYKITLYARTTKGKGICDPCGCSKGVECAGKPAVEVLVGYIFGTTTAEDGACCSCNDWSSGRIALWKKKTGEAYPVSDFRVVLLNRFGKAGHQKAEAVFELETPDGAKLRFAGFGGLVRQACGEVAIRSMSGFFAGQLTSYCSIAEDPCSAPILVPTSYRLLCQDVLVDDDPRTAAYGRWKIAWDSKLVNRLKYKSADIMVKPNERFEDNPGTAFGKK